MVVPAALAGGRRLPRRPPPHRQVTAARPPRPSQHRCRRPPTGGRRPPGGCRVGGVDRGAVGDGQHRTQPVPCRAIRGAGRRWPRWRRLWTRPSADLGDRLPVPTAELRLIEMPTHRHRAADADGCVRARGWWRCGAWWSSAPSGWVRRGWCGGRPRSASPCRRQPVGGSPAWRTGSVRPRWRATRCLLVGPSSPRSPGGQPLGWCGGGVVNPFGGLCEWLRRRSRGWGLGGDQVFAGITNWIAGGGAAVGVRVVRHGQLDLPSLDAVWFSGTAGSP